nr:MAG TPA: hypothetical protein [Caudoviricetes sp.]
MKVLNIGVSNLLAFFIFQGILYNDVSGRE